MKKKIAGIVLATLVFFPAYGVLFQDDFESDTVGNDPSGWTVNEGTRDSTANVVATNGFGAGSKAVKIYDPGGNSEVGFSYIQVNFTDGNDTLRVPASG